VKANGAGCLIDSPSVVRRIFFWLYLACLILSGCNQRPEGVDFIFLNGAEPQTIDPALITGQADGRIAGALFEGLTARNAHGIPEPAVAESWDVSPDGKRYTFHIRPNLVWSNGDPLTAHDFEESWRRVLEPETHSRYAEIMFFIRNAEKYQSGQITDFSQVGIRALDDLTLQVDLENPTTFFPDLVSFCTYLPVHMPTVKKYGKDWVKPGNIVSNGAYNLIGWKLNDRFEFEKNPRYWRKDTVHFRRIDALSVSDASTAFNLYYRHQADLIMDKGLIPSALIADLREDPHSGFHANPFLATYFYRFNVTRKPFDDVRVRKALSLAIDKKRIVEKITCAGELVAGSMTPPGIPGYEPPKGLGYNPDEARRLLAEAGYPGGKGFPRIDLLYNKTEQNEAIATEIQAMWKNTLGIHAELRNQEWKTYLKSLDDLTYDVARSSWVGDYDDPNTFLDCFVTGRGNNRTGWSNAAYDRFMADACAEPDAQKRFSLMQQAESLLVEQEVPIIPLYFNVGIVFYDDNRLGGFFPNVVDEHPLRELYWKP